MKNSEEVGTLAIGEFHPAASIAFKYIERLGIEKILKYNESFSSCALSGNRLGEICGETLKRFLNKEPVSDRYLMGLAWSIWQMENEE